jgi:uncharacterized ferredoxin-like protein
MAKIESAESERRAILAIAEQMTISARTAPKTRGVDSTSSIILEGKELQTLAQNMESIFGEDPERLQFFKENAYQVRNSTVVLVIGVTGEPKKPEKPLDCGACGMNCQGMINTQKIERGTARGPMCHMQSIDLGIALGSAVKTAGIMNADNRIMYSIGAAARKAGMINADLAIGIPLSSSGQNIYWA